MAEIIQLHPLYSISWKMPYWSFNNFIMLCNISSWHLNNCSQFFQWHFCIQNGLNAESCSDWLLVIQWPCHFILCKWPFFNYIKVTITRGGAWRKVIRVWGSQFNFPNHNIFCELAQLLCLPYNHRHEIRKVIHLILLITKATPGVSTASSPTNMYIFVEKKTGWHELPNSAVTTSHSTGQRCLIHEY